MVDDDGDCVCNGHYDDGNISCGCPAWAPMLGFMGCDSAAILANLGWACEIHKNHWMCKHYSYDQKYFRTSMIVVYKFLKLNLIIKQLKIKFHWAVLTLLVRRSLLRSVHVAFYHTHWVIEFHRLDHVLLEMEHVLMMCQFGHCALNHLSTINMLLARNLSTSKRSIDQNGRHMRWC